MASECAGVYYLQKENYRSGLNRFKLAVKYGDKGHYSLACIALCYFVLKKYDKAKIYAKKSLDIYSRSKYVLNLVDEIDGNKSCGIEYFDYSFNRITHEYLKYEKDYMRNALSHLYYLASESIHKGRTKKLRKGLGKISGNLSPEVVLSVSGRAKCIAGEIQEGLTDLRRAIEIKPTIQTLSNLSCCLKNSDSKENDRAAEKLDKELIDLLKSDPHNSPEFRNALWTLDVTKVMASDLYYLHDIILQDDPEVWQCHLCLGQCCYFRNEFEEALKHYSTAREYVNGNPVKISLVECQCALAMNDRAVTNKHIKQILTEDPIAIEQLKKVLGNDDEIVLAAQKEIEEYCKS